MRLLRCSCRNLLTYACQLSLGDDGSEGALDFSTGSRLDLDPVATSKWRTAAILGASQACSHQRRASENPGGACSRSPKERQREGRCGGTSSGDVQARAGGGEGDRLKLQAV
ncbi:hypothetical protein HPB47_025293 [Ixodes persulcatus]|uniref:Uncharacterized protein n=1 Tax=Ixodes persulcatus TaxID=34615 RepID=A0AC60Q2E0_IXOPE|nr:hypothetical protein HPB47_025293 [Ixodes persulcatus]